MKGWYVVLKLKKLFICVLVVCLLLVFGGCSQQEEVVSSDVNPVEDLANDMLGGDYVPEVYEDEGVGVVSFDDVGNSSGDTTRKLESDVSVELVSYDSASHTFVFNVEHKSDVVERFSIQDVQLFNNNDVIVQDELKLPELTAEFPTDEEYAAWDRAVYNAYNVDPGGSLVYQSRFSELDVDLSEFSISMRGYYETDVEMIDFVFTWKCEV